MTDGNEFAVEDLPVVYSNAAATKEDCEMDRLDQLKPPTIVVDERLG